MTDLTPDHPAAKILSALEFETMRVERAECAAAGMPASDHPVVQRAARVLEAAQSRSATTSAHLSILTALSHLTADDLRATDAAEEIRTEGWMQGWAAGRDLDGDEDATPYLRDTPAGRALMAEAWREATLWIRYRDGRWPQDMEDANPYEETPDDRP